MKKMSKMGKSILLSSLAIIAFGGIAAGTTYALFTSDATTSVSVTTGKVKVTQTVAVKSYYSPKSIKTDGTNEDDNNAATSSSFANGGKAEIQSDGSVKIDNMTPGDSVTLTVTPTNDSNVNIKYRESYSISGDNTSKLTVSGNEKMAKYWTALEANKTIEAYEVTIALPGDATETITNAVITLKVEAVQGNAYVVNNIEANEAQVADAIENAPAGSTIKFDSKDELKIVDTLEVKNDLTFIVDAPITSTANTPAFKVTSGTLTIEGNSSSDQQGVRLANKYAYASNDDISENKGIFANGYAITAEGSGKVVINGGTIASESGNGALGAFDGGTLEINGGTIINTIGDAIRADNEGVVTVNGGEFDAQESGVVAFRKSTVTINDGTFTAHDNFAVGTNGTTGWGGNNITINGGVFNAETQISADPDANGIYDSIACGVYVANNDNFKIYGGTFNITDGCGILARAGSTVYNDKIVKFNFKHSNENDINAVKMGRVGDALTYIPVDKEIVRDKVAGYQGGNPMVQTTKQNLIDAATYPVGYIISPEKVGTYEDLKSKVQSTTDSLYIQLTADITTKEELEVTAPNCVIDFNKHTYKLEKKGDNLTDYQPSAFIVKSTAYFVNGTIDANEIKQEGVSKDNQSDNYECDAIYANGSSASVHLYNMNINIDNNTGSCVYAGHDGKAYIHSGVYKNSCSVAYCYKPEWTAMTLNQRNKNGTEDLNQNIYVYGGQFYGVNPSLGDDNSSANVTTFLASSEYQSVSKSDGSTTYWNVSKKTA